MAEPNDLQRVSMNHLRNKLPAGSKFLLIGGAMQPNSDPRFEPDYYVARTLLINSQEVVEHFLIKPDGKIRPSE